MTKIPVKLRRPNAGDIDPMFSILRDALTPFLSVNEHSPENQLLIDRKFVKDYVEDSRYLTLVAETTSEIVGWVSGSSNNDILAEHKCRSSEFYLEEIVVNKRHRRKGIGKLLMNAIHVNDSKPIVLDTLLINEEAIKFYEKMGFTKLNDLPEEFSKNWTRMTKTK